MADAIKTPFTTADQAVDQLEGRDVASTIRYEAPASCPLSRLIKKTQIIDGKIVSGDGLIDVVPADQEVVEAYIHRSRAFEKSISAISSLNVTFTSVLDIQPRMAFANISRGDKCMGVINTVNTTTGVCAFETVGSDTFTGTAGDTLKFLGYKYEDGSNNPVFTQHADDQVLNVLGITRYPVKIDKSKATSKHLAGGDYFKRMKMYALNDVNRFMENDFIWGAKAASGQSTSMSGLGVSLRTQKGLWRFAQSNFNFGGNVTLDRIMVTMTNKMDDAFNQGKTYLWLMGRQSMGKIVSVINQNHVHDAADKTYTRYGIKTRGFQTNGPDLEIAVCEAFNGTGDGLILDPRIIKYRPKRGRDVHLEENIQGNAEDSYMDAFLAEYSFLPTCGGYEIFKTEGM